MDIWTVLSLIVAAAILVWIVLRVRNRRPSATPGIIPLLEGRLMRVDAEPAAVIDALEDVLSTYRERSHPSVPLLARAGFRWSGAPDEKPNAAYLCSDEEKRGLVITLRPVDGGTQVGMIPMHNRPDRMLIRMAGYLHTRIPVTSVGTIPSLNVALVAPRVPRDLVANTLTKSGYPVTATNVAITGRHAVAGALDRALKIVTRSDGKRAAKEWLEEWEGHDDHGTGTAEEQLDRLIQRLVAWDARVLTQVQDLPLQVRASLLDAIAERTPGSGWDELESVG
ncbi:MAG: hypothetical protein Q4F67_01955 [Propionibacteriaceae bacterium]|nr:hypothetical protein [Propionibacteriaceae bacterium]